MTDDTEILLEKWKHGMDLRALIYCIDEKTAAFISMQAIVGFPDTNNDEAFELHKHGGEGGECHEWFIDDDDYIMFSRYVFNVWEGSLMGIGFETKNGV